MSDKYNLAIEKKEKMIAESEAKINEYRERIKKLKNDVRELKLKKKEAYGRKFLEMCEKGNLDFENETLEQLFAKAGIQIPSDTKKNSHDEETTEPKGHEAPMQSLELEMMQ